MKIVITILIIMIIMTLPFLVFGLAFLSSGRGWPFLLLVGAGPSFSRWRNGHFSLSFSRLGSGQSNPEKKDQPLH